jgi:hypothetical protein
MTVANPYAWRLGLRLPAASTPAGSTVIYTFVEQVRRHGANAFAYFEWVFQKLMHHPAPEELQALLPAN